MFTGIVEEMGTIAEARVLPELARFRVECVKALEGTEIGDSVAVNGVCLTAVQAGGGGLSFEAVPETLRRTNLGALGVGDRVNLERPLSLSSRLGGHVVQGHIDGTATVTSVRPDGESLLFEFETSAEIARYVVEKGFVALDGVSLTVTHCKGVRFGVALIPYTIENVVMGDKGPGYRVNVEVDVIAKYLEKLARPYLEANSAGR